MATANKGVQERGGAWRILRHRDYRLLWFGQLVSSGGSQMQVVATAWLVYELTGSAVQLGLLGLLRAIPVMALSMVGGTFADTLDRRKVLLVTQSILMSLAAILAITTWTGVISMPLIYTITVLAGATNSFDNPARSALIPNLVPREELAGALTLNVTTFQLAQIVGPTVGGFIVAAAGAQGAYAIDAISFAAVLAALLLMRTTLSIPAEARPAHQRGIGALLEGFIFVRRNSLIFSVMMLDFLATLFGTVQSLLPVYAKDVLHVDASGLGLLYAATSAGAMGAALVLSARGRIQSQGLTLLVAVALFGLSLVGFGLSNIFWLSLLFLAGEGAADTVSMVLRGAILQLATPDELRGRTTAVHMTFAMGGPQLGQLRGGLLAGWIGPAGAVVSGGLAVIAIVAGMAALVPKIRLYRL
ncbi:MAG: MFS transporter [Thermomicrobiales bacterium]